MYKYSLAVCEDDKLIMENICRICENTLTDMGIDYEIRRFLSAEHLEETLGREGQIFDLLILDIELEKKREWNWPENCAQKEIGSVLLQKGNRKLRLHLETVLYAETDGNHGVRIFRQDADPDSFPISLSQLEASFSDQRFVRCHNSYLVNLQHMREMKRTGFLTDQGYHIPISRKYYKKGARKLLSLISTDRTFRAQEVSALFRRQRQYRFWDERGWYCHIFLQFFSSGGSRNRGRGYPPLWSADCRLCLFSIFHQKNFHI